MSNDPTLVQLRNHDMIQPFLLEMAGVRGRMVRLGPIIDEILSRHKYPLPVAGHLAELMTMGAMLAGTLKHNGILTMQVSAKGAIKSMACDVTHEGELRGYANFNDETLSHDITSGAPLLRDGYLAVTIDQAHKDERYQGIVELQGESLANALSHYFAQSEQVKTRLHLVTHQPPQIDDDVAQDIQIDDRDQDGVTTHRAYHKGLGDCDHWASAAIMLQQVPEHGGHQPHHEPSGLTSNDNADPTTGEDTRGLIRDEDWNRLDALLSTVTPKEMLDPETPINTVLYRLFHEEKPRVFDPIFLSAGCRCSRKRVASMLAQLLASGETIETLMDGGDTATIDCQFCSRQYQFDQKALEEMTSQS